MKTPHLQSMYVSVITTGQSMDVHGLTTGVRRVSSFWDLPYAEAPVGDLRFAVCHSHPSKHETLGQRWFTVGPTSKTVGQQ